MCTVTYIPNKQKGFILSSNRDETPLRAPDQVVHQRHGKESIIYPKDKGAGGSWIAVSESGKVACVLNGAEHKHSHRPPYRRSRGLMLLDLFYFNSTDEFAKQYCFDGMEPFTLIVAESKQLVEIRWNGTYLAKNVLDTQLAYLWSSSTLYNMEMRSLRKQWFQNWLDTEKDKNIDTIRSLHKTGGNGNKEFDYVMDREKVKTISISQIESREGSVHFRYEDLIKNQVEMKGF